MELSAVYSIQATVISSMAVASITTTVTRARLTSGLRSFMKNRGEFLGELFACPYCFSHWVAAGVALLWGWNGVISWLFTTFVLVTSSMFWVGIIGWGLQQVAGNDSEEKAETEE